MCTIIFPHHSEHAVPSPKKPSAVPLSIPEPHPRSGGYQPPSLLQVGSAAGSPPHQFHNALPLQQQQETTAQPCKLPDNSRLAPACLPRGRPGGTQHSSQHPPLLPAPHSSSKILQFQREREQKDVPKPRAKEAPSTVHMHASSCASNTDVAKGIPQQRQEGGMKLRQESELEVQGTGRGCWFHCHSATAQCSCPVLRPSTAAPHMLGSQALPRGPILLSAPPHPPRAAPNISAFRAALCWHRRCRQYHFWNKLGAQPTGTQHQAGWLTHHSFPQQTRAGSRVSSHGCRRAVPHVCREP